MAQNAGEVGGFRGRLRRSQSLALDAVEALRAAGERSAYVVLPPGAGKTVVGLEAARRLGRRTLVLTPHTVVQQQWVEQWERFGDGTPAATSGALEHPLTVLTYQSLTVWDRTADDEDVEDDASAGAAARRRAAVRGDAGADLLDLLHPAGRELVRRAAGLGPWTLVLDEAHHLLETWGALVPALVEALGVETWLVGMTATSPSELTSSQRVLYDELFGPAFEVATPAVVKDGDLAPYQELVYVTEPTAQEEAWIAGERSRFAGLQEELLLHRTGTVPFRDWLAERLTARRTAEGEALPSWRDLEAAEPDLTRAALRLVAAGRLDLPEGARLREEHRLALDARDWAALLGAYAHEHLVPSRDLHDERLLRAIREALPGLGWQLTIRGLRSVTSPVDRVCALSVAKASAAVEILGAERADLGEALRGLVLCDAEHRPAPLPSRPRDAGPDGPGISAQLVLEVLAASDLGPSLRPVMVTGRTVAMRRQDVPNLRAFAPSSVASLLRVEPLGGSEELVRLLVEGDWSARRWTPLMAAWLASGGTQVVVGTRALLGEGWDCPQVGVVVDLTAATTATTVPQVRGRSLRLDPARPGKVADNWTVVTVADDHPRGDADHLRAVRKHASHLAPGPEGEIESGIGHCDDALAPYPPPSAKERAEINARALARAGAKDAARELWGVGQGYRGAQVETVRVRSERPLGLPGGVVKAGLLRPTTTLGTDVAPAASRRRAAPLWPIPTGAGLTAAGGAVAASADPAAGAVIGTATAAVSAVVLGSARYVGQLHALRGRPDDGRTATLRQLAAAVADGLRAAGDTSVGAGAVTVRAGRNGWVRCELDAPAEESRVFARCLDELLAPLGDPRWLVSRPVLEAPATAAERRRLARARTFGRRVDVAVTWHAVPAALGRSKATVAAFDDAWHAHVGMGRLVAGRDPEGQALLALLRGADPFGLTSRVRAVWR